MSLITHTSLRRIPLFVFLSPLFCITTFIHAQEGNQLLQQATRLLQSIDASHTSYQHKDNLVHWSEAGQPAVCYADCSGFLNALISKTFHWTASDFSKQFGHSRMYAWHYYQAIADQHLFMHIDNIGSIQPGDIIAIQYADRSEHEDNTGHIMLVSAKPRVHEASKVFIPGTDQYEVEVIDCSRSPHGKTDTRWAEGQEYNGLGRGPLRLYADKRGAIVGYSWSPGNPKPDFNPTENPVLVGRFISPKQ